MSNPQPLHQSGHGVLCVLTRTHPCDASGTSKRQLVFGVVVCVVVVVVNVSGGVSL